VNLSSDPNYSSVSLVQGLNGLALTGTLPEEEETAAVPPKKGISGGGSVSVNYDKFASSSTQSENASKIKQKKLTTSETNIGGLPKADWREWAESVKERPMPIIYGTFVDFFNDFTHTRSR